MKLEDLEIYQLSMGIGDNVWNLVMGWEYFIKDTMGKQLVKAVGSIAANIGEGFGRYHFKDKKKFQLLFKKIIS